MEREIFMTQTIKDKEITFALDKNGILYVNDKKVLTTEKLQLEGWSLFFLAITGIAACIQALVSVLDYLRQDKIYGIR